MKIKTNAIIGLIFVGLFGFVYFHEIKGGEERRREAEKSKQLLDFKDTEVARIELDRGDTVVVLAKGNDGWKITRPVADGADEGAARGGSKRPATPAKPKPARPPLSKTRRLPPPGRPLGMMWA